MELPPTRNEGSGHWCKSKIGENGFFKADRKRIRTTGSRVGCTDRFDLFILSEHGEPFIRGVAAYDVSCLMEYKAMSLEEAMYVVVNEKLPGLEGEGGMIGVDAQGNASMIFNSAGMYRALKTSDGREELAIYR